MPKGFTIVMRCSAPAGYLPYCRSGDNSDERNRNCGIGRGSSSDSKDLRRIASRHRLTFLRVERSCRFPMGLQARTCGQAAEESQQGAAEGPHCCWTVAENRFLVIRTGSRPSISPGSCRRAAWCRPQRCRLRRRFQRAHFRRKHLRNARRWRLGAAPPTPRRRSSWPH
jgi:hypothetical protein